MNNSTQERGVWGAVWHIAGTNLPAARGSAEWTQLGGWSGARAGAPWRQTDTAEELRQRKEKVYHTQTLKRTFTRALLRFHTLVSPFLIKGRRVPVKDTPPPGASCSSCRRLCISVVFVLFFFPFLSFLASVALLLVHVHAVSPSMTRASHSARWTSHLAQPTLPSEKLILSQLWKTNGIPSRLTRPHPQQQLCTNTFWLCCGFSGSRLFRCRQSGTLLKLSKKHALGDVYGLYSHKIWELQHVFKTYIKPSLESYGWIYNFYMH